METNRFLKVTGVLLLGTVLLVQGRRLASLERCIDSLLSTVDVDGLTLVRVLGRLDRLEAARVRLKLDVETEGDGNGPDEVPMRWLPLTRVAATTGEVGR